jgi:beta-glucosidase
MQDHDEVIDGEIDKIISHMSLKDKIAFCSGKDEWNTKAFEKYHIPSMMMSDGPHGLRKQEQGGDMLGVGNAVKATCFPTSAITACSFDCDVIKKVGSAIAKECLANKVGMILGPGITLKRNPLCGRNFEYFSEDPYLSGKLGAAYIQAVQKHGIATSLKHFACNHQEYFRMVSDSIVDERTLRELYLYPFEIAVKEGHPDTVMCAYNRINGTFCSENPWLLTEVLRNEWGFNGVVVTDWNAVGDRTIGFQSGCDLAMPGGSGYGEADAYKNVKKKVLDEALVDLSVKRILKLVLHANKTLQNPASVDMEEHHKLAATIAEESAVLLKNEGQLLPFEDMKGVVLIGQMAEDFRYQGHGSSCITPTKVEQLRTLLPDMPYEPGYTKEGKTNRDLIERAKKLAAGAEKVLIIAGLPDTDEAEGFDRPNMKMPLGQNKVIEEVSKVNPNVAVVLCCGSAVEVEWADQVRSILYMGLSGQAGAEALVHLITGVANPSGKMAQTWPVVYEDCPSARIYGNDRDALYVEGLYMGYRYYDKAEKNVRFAFGEGGSYTTFTYTGITVIDESKEKEHCYHVTVTVKNTGERPGKEAVLLYVCPPQDGVYRPLKELKGFEKIALDPGETKSVDYYLDNRSFAVWDDGFKVPEGNYRIEAGNTWIENNVLSTSFFVSGEVITSALKTGRRNWYNHPVGNPDRVEWLKMLKKDVIAKPLKPYTVDSAFCDVSKESWLLRKIYKIYEKEQEKAFGLGTVDYKSMIKMAEESNLRCIQSCTYMKHHLAQSLADIANKKYLKALIHFLH